MTIREFITKIINDRHFNMDSEIFIDSNEEKNSWNVNKNSIKDDGDGNLVLLIDKMEDGFYE